MKNALLAALALGIAHSPALAQSAANADAVPWDSTGRLFLFGDSRTDTGSGGGLTGNGNPENYTNGAMSNGPLWWAYAYPNKPLAVDVFGNNIVGSTENGINFARGGNTVLPGQFGPLANQVNSYLGRVSGNVITKANSNDTFVIWMGQGGDNALALAEMKRNLDSLVSSGAKRFIIIGTTSFAGAPDGGVVGAEYNSGLKSLARNMISNGATVMYIDAGFAPVINDILAHSDIYGVKDATRFCRPTYTSQNCPSDYLWWNPGHFTTAVNKIFGAYVAATATNINYTAGTYAQVLNTTYQVHRGTVDLLSSNALSQSGDRFTIYGFDRYTSGHANAQSLSSRAEYSGNSIGMGAVLPLSGRISIGVSGAYYEGDAQIAGPVGGSDRSSAYDIAGNLLWRNGGNYVQVMGGAGEAKIKLTRDTSFSWRPTVQSSPSVNSAFASLEAGTEMKVGNATLSPFGRVDFANFEMKRIQESGVFFASVVDEAQMDSWQIAGGVKADIPLSETFRLGLTGSVSKELAGDTQVSALVDVFNRSYANLDMGRGVTANGAINLSGQIWKSVSARVEVGGRTGELASDGYVQASLSVPF